MKTLITLGFCCFFGWTSYAQNQATNAKQQLQEESEIPFVYQFEPEFEAIKQQKRDSLKAKIAVLDTMSIPVKKRERLIKALYKDVNSKAFDKLVQVSKNK